jgi:glycosyltransferase involved in cell wall biosynthesis
MEVTVWTTDAFDVRRRCEERPAIVDGIQVYSFSNLSNRLAYHLQLYLPRGLWAHAHAHVREFDLVHLHAHRHLLNAIAAAAARRAGVPYVLTGHGTVPAIERRLLVKRWVDALGARALLERAAFCIAVSPAEVAQMRTAGVAPERIRVIPNGIRLDAFRVLPARGHFRAAHGLGDAPVVLFLGKITPRKGVDVLIRALAKLPSAVQLVIAGNLMMSGEPLRRLTSKLALGEQVHFVGHLDDEEKLAAYRDADVVAYPSVHEIFGLVPFEALMCGTPVVVCNDSGCGEVMKAAGGGLLVPYGDPEALADALTTLLNDAALRAECVSRARQYIQSHLSWDAIAERTAALYDDVLAHAPQPAASVTALCRE